VEYNHIFGLNNQTSFKKISIFNFQKLRNCFSKLNQIGPTCKKEVKCILCVSSYEGTGK